MPAGDIIAAPQSEEYVMIRIGWLTACAAVACLSIQIASGAEDAKAPTPTAEHKRLGYFVGTWTTEGEMQPSEMGPGGKFKGTDKCTWFEGGFAVVCNSEGTSSMGPNKSLGILGYSAEEKVYTYSGVDSSGMTMTTVPRGKIQGDTWTYYDESMMGGKKVKSRVVIKELSPTQYTFKMDFQNPDGTWATAMESKSTKTK
jgi:hypothetical protein